MVNRPPASIPPPDTRRVAVMANGRIIAEGPPSTLGMRGQAGVQIRYRLPDGAGPPARAVGPVDGHGVTQVEVDSPEEILHELTGWALAHHVHLEDLEVSRPSLEEVYLALTSRATGSA